MIEIFEVILLISTHYGLLLRLLRVVDRELG